MTDTRKNYVELSGTIATDVSLRYVGEAGKAKVWCILAVDAGEYNSKKREDRIPLTLWGEDAEDFANRVSKGAAIEVTNGKVSVSRFKPQGSDEWKDDWGVTVFEWKPAGQQGGTRPMGSELGGGFPLDDDDVPFSY